MTRTTTRVGRSHGGEARRFDREEEEEEAGRRDWTPRIPMPVSRGRMIAAMGVALEMGRERYRICVSETLRSVSSGTLVAESLRFLRGYDGQSNQDLSVPVRSC